MPYKYRQKVAVEIKQIRSALAEQGDRSNPTATSNAVFGPNVTAQTSITANQKNPGKTKTLQGFRLPRVTQRALDKADSPPDKCGN